LAVAVLFERVCQSLQLRGIDEALAEGDFLETGDAQILAILDRAYELAGGQQRIARTRVEPAIAAAEPSGCRRPPVPADCRLPTGSRGDRCAVWA